MLRRKGEMVMKTTPLSYLPAERLNQTNGRKAPYTLHTIPRGPCPSSQFLSLSINMQAYLNF